MRYAGGWCGFVGFCDGLEGTVVVAVVLVEVGYEKGGSHHFCATMAATFIYDIRL